MSRYKPVKRTDGVVETRGRKKNTIHSKLSRKQELFVKELVSNDGLITFKEAAIKAGYPESSAHTRAYELTNPHKCPHVVAAIKAEESGI